MASPSPTTTHEARSAAWNALWRALLTEPDDDSPASDPSTDPEPVRNDDDEAAQAAA